ncbi:hypothetical protein VAI68_26810, partial [Klebsiella pneumoniae]
ARGFQKPKNPILKDFLSGPFGTRAKHHHQQKHPANQLPPRPFGLVVFSVLNVKTLRERYREPVTPSCKACFDLFAP